MGGAGSGLCGRWELRNCVCRRRSRRTSFNLELALATNLGLELVPPFPVGGSTLLLVIIGIVEEEERGFRWWSKSLILSYRMAWGRRRTRREHVDLFRRDLAETSRFMGGGGGGGNRVLPL